MKSRAQIKIAEAVKAFGVDFRGKMVLDIGSSTGGFTDFALKNGAKKVIAVEKGTKQMRAPLCFDERVELHEKMDVFDFRCDEKIEMILADVSFVSLRRILAYAKKNLANQETEFLVMLKPQFETEERNLVNGIVKNKAIRRKIVADFEFWLKENNFIVLKKRDNEMAGKYGNVERFYLLKMGK